MYKFDSLKPLDFCFPISSISIHVYPLQRRPNQTITPDGFTDRESSD